MVKKNAQIKFSCQYSVCILAEIFNSYENVLLIKIGKEIFFC